jgi:hypothetical protein
LPSILGAVYRLLKRSS